ncbi:DinB/YfiT-like putative metal-dependent hydrolase protein [Dioscorea alata]|uniref:DinB/YfiT-like putative metal-dependent hydrolase protein n=1 Tax=Dioscorea alata TaxID=55571 RepID=A0ACB7VRU5_DIOAL|nr:DinB/YfiT-like putative metal-dependent hydrolase protein [Dioscorea alata]
MAAIPSLTPENEPAEANALPPAKAFPAEAVDGAGDGPAGPAPIAVEKLRHQVDAIISKVDELEVKVNEVAQFYANKKRSKGAKDGKDKKMAVSSCSNLIVCESALNVKDGSSCTKRMQELMRQFGTILRQISQHKWAWPFMEPVDVEGLGLHDYYDIIKKPMDFSTIKNQMEAKDGTGYKNVREIYADVRLVFTNAMTYNDEKNDIHVMAKTLLDKFEEKWLQLLPKVIEEERRQKEEEAQAHENMQIAQEAAVSKMAKDMNNELAVLNSQLDGLRELVVQKCRKMSAEEKRRLGAGLSNLSAEDLSKVLEIIAQNNPSFRATTEEVEIDLDAQSETTLWKLKFFMKGAMELQTKNSPSNADENLKRKKEICDALAKTAKRRSKLLSSA